MLVNFTHTSHKFIVSSNTYNCNSYDLKDLIEEDFHKKCKILLEGENITSINMLKMGNKFVYNVRTDKQNVEMTYTAH